MSKCELNVEVGSAVTDDRFTAFCMYPWGAEELLAGAWHWYVIAC